MAGVKCLLGGLHHGIDRDLGDDDLDLDLRQEGAVHRHTTVFFSGAFLDAAAHDLRDRHAGDAQIVEDALELVELGKLCNDGHFVHPGVVDAVVDDSRLTHHRHSSGSWSHRWKGSGKSRR